MNNSQLINNAKVLGRNLISVFDGYLKGFKSETEVHEAVITAISQLPCYTYEGEVYECSDSERQDLKEYVEDIFDGGIERSQLGFGGQSLLYTIFNDLAGDIINEWRTKPASKGMTWCPISGGWSAKAAAANEKAFGKNWRDIFNGL